MTEERTTSYTDVDPVQGLRIAWSDEELNLAERARLVSRFKMKSRLTIEGAARLCDTSPAKIQAMLDLATLDDDNLDLVSDANPPVTTWVLFAGMESEAISAGIDAFKAIPPGQPVLSTVYEAIRRQTGPDIDERIVAISGETFGHLYDKAIQYGQLKDKDRNFLASVAKRKRTGKPVTEKQIPWLKSILFELAEAEVIRRDSPDCDQAQCDEVLDALGL